MMPCAKFQIQDKKMLNSGARVELQIQNLELYPLVPPPNGMTGTVLHRTHHLGLMQMFGVELPMLIVQFELDGYKSFSVYEDDVKIVEE